MNEKKYLKIEENMKLRNKLLNLGFGCQMGLVGPTARYNKSSIYIFKW